MRADYHKFLGNGREIFGNSADEREMLEISPKSAARAWELASFGLPGHRRYELSSDSRSQMTLDQRSTTT
jgi:hypothetical protein